MTESWAINTFIIGCIILMAVPVFVYLYQEGSIFRRGDISDI